MSIETNKLQAVRDIVVYGPEDCRDCAAVIDQLARRGITARKVIIDDSHAAIVETAQSSGHMAAPLVYVDTQFIFSGRNIAEVIKLAREEHDLLFEEGLVNKPSNSLLISR